MHNHKLTYAQLVRYYCPYLTEIASGQELTETRQLIAQVVHCTVEELMRWELRGDYAPEDIHTQLEPLIYARQQGIPLQHLMGTVYFCGREFYIEPGVFIPRPETELLAEWMQGIMRKYSEPVRVLDLCTGSGILAIIAACAGAEVTAVDINPQAIALAQRNALRHNILPQSINWVQSDVISWLENARDEESVGHKYEIIVSNPPYIPLGTPVSATVAHDPAIAVFSGPTGLDCISGILPLLSPYFTTEGYLGLEHDISHHESIRQIMQELGYYDTTLHTDLAGLARFTTACWRESHRSPR